MQVFNILLSLTLYLTENLYTGYFTLHLMFLLYQLPGFFNSPRATYFCLVMFSYVEDYWCYYNLFNAIGLLNPP